MRTFKFVAAVVSSSFMLSTPVYASSITLTQATSTTVTATIQPDAVDLGKAANIWMGAIYGGALFIRNDATWAPYAGGPIPVAIGGTTLSASTSVNVVSGLDVSLLPGLQLYIGYGASETDMLTSPGKLARIYPDSAPQFGGVIFSTANNTDQVTIAWLDAKDYATPASKIRYNIYVSTTPNFTPSPASLYQSVTGAKQAVISGLKAGTAYTISVVAVNADGIASSGTKSVSITTLTDPVVLSSKTPLFNAQSNGLGLPTVMGTDYHVPYTGSPPSLPQTGAILVGNDATGGYLRKVVGSSIVANEIVVQTSDGSLTEAVDQGAISNKMTLFDTPPSSGSSTSTSRLSTLGFNGATRLDAVGPNTIEWQDDLLKFEEVTNPGNAAGLLIERNNQSGRYSISPTTPSSTHDKTPRAVTGSIDEQLGYDVSVTFAPELATDIKWSTLGTKILKADVVASGTLTLDAKAFYKFAGANKFSKDYTFDVFTRTWTSVYSAGAVPVYQEVTFTLGVHLQAEAKTAINANAEANVSQTVQFGVHYNPATGLWEPSAPSTSQTQSLKADLSVQGGVTSEIRLIPNIEVKFYKVVAANLSVEPVISENIQAQAVANADLLAGYFPPGIVQLTAFDASLNAQCFVGANLQILSKTIPLLNPTQVCDIPAYSFFSLPTLGLTSSKQANGTYSLVASIKDGDNDPFDDKSIKWIVYPSSAGTLQATGRQATFTPSLTASTGAAINATIFFSGFGSLGEMGRQFAQVQVALSKYTDNGNGTVTDNITHLTWQQGENPSTYDWYQASGTSQGFVYDKTKILNVCGSLSLAGGGWRLPTMTELESLFLLDGSVGTATHTPTINLTFFPHAHADAYWSSLLSSSGWAYTGDFTDGTSYYRYSTYNKFYVRCVRS